MIMLNFLTGFYAKLRKRRGVPLWLFTPIRKIVRLAANRILPIYLSKYTSGIYMPGNNIIVSLTSFPSRIDNVWQVIVCMLNQTLPPKGIVLWLSKEQFPTKESIPQSLKNLEGKVFRIRLVDGDIRSHKKYYYAFQEFKDELLFLIDDDIYYPTDLLEKAWNAHLQYPNSIICNYGYHMTYNDEGLLEKYKNWKVCYNHSDDTDLFFGSGGGTLIHSSSLYKDTTNLELALKLTPNADDVWLNAMVRLSGMRIHMLRHGSFLPIVLKDDVRLTKINNGYSQNDVQIAAVDNYYDRVFAKMD